jgi:hypothetical protein
MPNVYKILGQVHANNAGQYYNLYTVPNGVSAICSSIIVTNLNTSPAKFNIAVCPSGVASPNEQHFIYYEVNLPINDTFIATVGVTLAGGDSIKVYSDVGKTVTFNLSGTEIV